MYTHYIHPLSTYSFAIYPRVFFVKMHLLVPPIFMMVAGPRSPFHTLTKFIYRPGCNKLDNRECVCVCVCVCCSPHSMLGVVHFLALARTSSFSLETPGLASVAASNSRPYDWDPESARVLFIACVIAIKNSSIFSRMPLFNCFCAQILTGTQDVPDLESMLENFVS